MVLGGVSGLFVLAAAYSVVRGGIASLLPFALPCLLAAVMAGLLLRLEESRRVAAAMAVLSAMAALWAGDAFLATRPVLETRDDVRAEAARVAGVSPDPRSMVEVVGALRRTGVDAWPAVYIGNHWQGRSLFRDTLYPLASISGVTSVMCREASYVVYRSDEHGFTNPPGQWRMTQAELALVGDSYVMGWCVRPQDSFAAAIRARHAATIVLGHGASGPLTQLGQMREYLGPLRPRHVLWFYYEENDLPDLTAEQANRLLARYLEPGFTQRLAGRQAEVDQRLRTFSVQAESAASRRASTRAAAAPRGGAGRAAWSILTLGHLRRRLTALRQPPPPLRPCCDLPLLRRVMGAMQATVAGWGGDLAVVYLPSEYRLAGRPMRPGERAGDRVVAIADSLGVAVLDLRPVLGRYGSARDLFVYQDAHFTVRGHRAVATLVLDFLAHRDSLGTRRDTPRLATRH